MLHSWAQPLQCEGKAWSGNVEKWMECMRKVHGKGENKENRNRILFRSTIVFKFWGWVRLENIRKWLDFTLPHRLWWSLVESGGLKCEWLGCDWIGWYSGETLVSSILWVSCSEVILSELTLSVVSSSRLSKSWGNSLYSWVGPAGMAQWWACPRDSNSDNNKEQFFSISFLSSLWGSFSRHQTLSCSSILYFVITVNTQFFFHSQSKWNPNQYRCWFFLVSRCLDIILLCSHSSCLHDIHGSRCLESLNFSVYLFSPFLYIIDTNWFS